MPSLGNLENLGLRPGLGRAEDAGRERFEAVDE